MPLCGVSSAAESFQVPLPENSQPSRRSKPVPGRAYFTERTMLPFCTPTKRRRHGNRFSFMEEKSAESYLPSANIVRSVDYVRGFPHC